MKNRKMLLSVLLLAAPVFSLILAASVVGASPAPVNMPQGQVEPMVAAGWGHTVGLKDDGTAFALGDNRYGQCNVGGWKGITQVATGTYHRVGLKSDSTVVAVGLETDLTERNLGATGSDGTMPVNWSLVGGVIAVLAAALTIFFVLSRRPA